MRGANFAHNDTIVTLLYQLVSMGGGGGGGMVAENKGNIQKYKEKKNSYHT
jgi:hypothetical protein